MLSLNKSRDVDDGGIAAACSGFGDLSEWRDKQLVGKKFFKEAFGVRDAKPKTRHASATSKIVAFHVPTLAFSPYSTD